MIRASQRYLFLLFAFTLLISSFLLFWIQPLLAKMLLPFLGGSPGVWNICMMFFQGILLAGYLYAHISARYLPRKIQSVLQLTLLILGLFFLPFVVNGAWFQHLDSPTLSLVTALLTIAAMPLFALCATAPLLQRWFTHTNHQHAEDPYFLYAASNVGSVLALFMFSFVLEPWFTISNQNNLWRVFFGLLILLTGACAISRITSPKNKAVSTDNNNLETNITFKRRMYWLALAFAPSSLLLGVTTYITTDIASVPLLWIIPLTLYLMTFILAFMRTPLISINTSQICQLTLVFPILFVFVEPLGLMYNWIILLIHASMLFFTALVCNQELVSKRPHHKHLTEFYLWLALGGFLGGVFNALLAPMIFTNILEYPIVLFFALLLRPPTFISRKIMATAMTVLAVIFAYDVTHLNRDNLFVARNFFGTTRVKVVDKKLHYLVSDTTNHGLQLLAPDKQKSIRSYYYPLVNLFKLLHTKQPQLRTAVAGLGAGITACLANKNDIFTFYEINPSMVTIASNPKYFTYLTLCPPKGGIILGDARLQLQNAKDNSYDVILLDAFSSDAIPVHLLTLQAIKLYQKKLSPDGVLLIHITNRYLNLKPVLNAIAEKLKLHGWHRHFIGDKDQFESEAIWVVLSASPTPFGPNWDEQNWTPLSKTKRKILWTDDYSNIVRLFEEY